MPKKLLANNAEWQFQLIPKPFDLKTLKFVLSSCGKVLKHPTLMKERYRCCRCRCCRCHLIHRQTELNSFS